MAIDFVGNDFGQILDGNAGANRLYGRGGTDLLQGNDGDDVLDGGAGADTLYGLIGDDTFVFVIGEANGDSVVDFSGNGAAAGDSLQLVGYGADATFTRVDGTHWQVNYHGGTEHEVINFLNGGADSIHPSDVSFF
jgi:Ca2+-binding RTX toxin-like protein